MTTSRRRRIAPARKARRPQASMSAGFALYWALVHKGVPLEAEYHFCRPRKFRFDFAHIASRVAIELDGGTWIGGRHTTGAGHERDAEKFNLAASRGWVVFRLTPAMLRAGAAGWCRLIGAAIEGRPECGECERRRGR